MSPLGQIGAGFLLLAVTVALHAVVILAPLRPLRRILAALRPARALHLMVIVVLAVVLGLAASTLVEAAIWSAALVGLGALPDFAGALYFVLVTMTTLGFGDVVLGAGFRLIAGLCALTGLLTIGMTTAFLIELVRRFAERAQAG